MSSQTRTISLTRALFVAFASAAVIFLSGRQAFAGGTFSGTKISPKVMNGSHITRDDGGNGIEFSGDKNLFFCLVQPALGSEERC